VTGDHTICRFANRTRAGKALVEPEQPALIGNRSQGRDCGVRPAAYLAIRQDQFDGRGKFLARDLWKLLTCLLEPSVADPFASQASPVLNPRPAKTAVAVED